MVALKRVGVWSVGLRNDDPGAREEIQSAAAELEELGYGAVWLGSSPHPDHALPLLEATSDLVVATGIFRIWDQDAASIAARHAAITAVHPGRFLLGLGASHSSLVKQYSKPYSATVEYLDGLDAAATPVPKQERVLAALGPKMLELARDRALGAHPYLVTPEHTAKARAALGAGPLLAPEIKVAWGSDLAAARERARAHLAYYLRLPNYTNNLVRDGFTEEDLAGGGSDRLIDATFVLGGHDAVRDRVRAFFDAGADHAVLQVITADRMELPREEWREIAAALDLPRFSAAH